MAGVNPGRVPVYTALKTQPTAPVQDHLDGHDTVQINSHFSLRHLSFNLNQEEL